MNISDSDVIHYSIIDCIVSSISMLANMNKRIFENNIAKNEK